MPSSRYYSEVGIRLFHSGIKRLLDVWNRHVNVVKVINLCVFQASKFHKKNFRHGVIMLGNY